MAWGINVLKQTIVPQENSISKSTPPEEIEGLELCVDAQWQSDFDHDALNQPA